MMFKIIAVRLLVFAPIPILYAAPLNVRMGGDPVGGLLTALKLVFLAFAFQPIAVALHFSSRSNDTRQLKWSIIILLAAVLAILVALVTCFIIAITANSILVRLLAWVAIAALSLAIWAGYGWFFNRGRFDVLETPKN